MRFGDLECRYAARPPLEYSCTLPTLIPLLWRLSSLGGVTRHLASLCTQRAHNDTADLSRVQLATPDQTGTYHNKRQLPQEGAQDRNKSDALPLHTPSGRYARHRNEHNLRSFDRSPAMQ